MQLGFVGLGAVVETANLPALRRLFGHTVHCFGFDVLPTRQPEGVTRCASFTDLLAVPLDLSLLPPHRCTTSRCWNRP